MIDIKLSDGEHELLLSEYETWESLERDLVSILNCTTEKVIERTEEDFTIELIGFPHEGLINFDDLRIDQIFKGYKQLLEFEEEEQNIILAYICINDYNICCGVNNMYDALDNYVGKGSSRSVAKTVLSEQLSMDPFQISYVLDTLDCENEVIDDACDCFDEWYFYK